MEGFNYVHPIEVRFKDIDVLGHVNNVIILTYLETARVAYLGAVKLCPVQTDLRQIPFIIAHLSCDFRRPIFYGQQVEVGARIAHLGRSSLRLEQRVEAEGRLAAEGHAILVHYDYEADQSAVLPAQMRRQIADFEGRDFS